MVFSMNVSSLEFDVEYVTLLQCTTKTFAVFCFEHCRCIGACMLIQSFLDWTPNTFYTPLLILTLGEVDVIRSRRLQNSTFKLTPLLLLTPGTQHTICWLMPRRRIEEIRYYKSIRFSSSDWQLQHVCTSIREYVLFIHLFTKIQMHRNHNQRTQVHVNIQKQSVHSFNSFIVMEVAGTHQVEQNWGKPGDLWDSGLRNGHVHCTETNKKEESLLHTRSINAMICGQNIETNETLQTLLDIGKSYTW